MDVDIDLIKPSPYQPRLFFEVDDLKEEIQRDGLLSALVVRKKDEYYELLDGERRLRTLKELGWKRVPIDTRDVDDTTARRAVYKLNKIRENYETKDEATYFKKLFDEGMKPYEIETQLGADHQWVQACLNIWKFPEHVQREVFLTRGSSRYLFMSDIRDLEPVINRNLDQAIAIASEIIAGRLNQAEKRRLITGRVAVLDEARVKAAKEALPEVVAKLETPEDYEKAAQALQEEAKRRAEEAMTPEEKAALEAERKAKAEAQALAKAEREEEKRQKKAEEEGRRQERAEAKAREQLKGDKAFVTEALKAMPEEEVVEMLDMVPIPGKAKKVKSLEEEFDQIMKMASKVVDNLDKLKREGKVEQLNLKQFSITLRILADYLNEFAKLAEGSP